MKSINQSIQSFFAYLVLTYNVTVNLVAQARSLALTFHIQSVIQAWPVPSSWPAATPSQVPPGPPKQPPPHSPLWSLLLPIPSALCLQCSCLTKCEVSSLLKDYPWLPSVSKIRTRSLRASSTSLTAFLPAFHPTIDSSLCSGHKDTSSFCKQPPFFTGPGLHLPVLCGMPLCSCPLCTPGPSLQDLLGNAQLEQLDTLLSPLGCGHGSMTAPPAQNDSFLLFLPRIRDCILHAP